MIWLGFKVKVSDIDEIRKQFAIWERGFFTQISVLQRKITRIEKV